MDNAMSKSIFVMWQHEPYVVSDYAIRVCGVGRIARVTMLVNLRDGSLAWVEKDKLCTLPMVRLSDLEMDESNYEIR